MQCWICQAEVDVRHRLRIAADDNKRELGAAVQLSVLICGKCVDRVITAAHEMRDASIVVPK